MAIERPNRNPYSGFNFTMEADGEQIAAFQEISGLDSENTPIEYREGADRINGVRKVPGMEKTPNLVCGRGITGSLALWNWRKEVRDGTGAFPPVRDVVISLQNEVHQTVMRWRLTNAWCCKLTGPTLNAKGNEIAIEKMELAYDRLEEIT